MFAHDRAPRSAPPPSSAVAVVASVRGRVSVVHPGGTASEARAGSLLRPGDSVVTMNDGAATFALIDGAELSVGESSCASIEDFTFDAESASGRSVLSVIEGTFVFSSGLIARSRPDAQVVNLPSATVGVRGPRIAGDVKSEGKETAVTLLGEVDGIDGTAVVATTAGERILSRPRHTVRVTSFADMPTIPAIITDVRVALTYGAILDFHAVNRDDDGRLRSPVSAADARMAAA